MTKNRFNPSPSGRPGSLESGGTRAVDPPQEKENDQKPQAKDGKQAP